MSAAGCDRAVTRVLITHPLVEEPNALATQLQAAMAKLPPTLAGAPTQPLEVGRASRVVTVAQRAALVVRDGGCGFPDCDRPPTWVKAIILALLYRTQHRAVHEGGWRLERDPDGHLITTPPQRRHRRPHAAA